VEVREILPDEYQRAGRLVVDAYLSVPGAHMTGGYEIELADVARRAVEASVLVAVEGTQVLGCVTYVPDHRSPWAEMIREGEASIRMLATDPDGQGRGVGSRLLAACIDRARVSGRDGMFLYSTPWMVVAHRLYQRAGFQRMPERDWLPVPDVPLWGFRLDLSGYRDHGAAHEETAMATERAGKAKEAEGDVRQEHNEFDPDALR
jgi:ribosomal protein S18 acetylase RimI-like enzyme